MIPGPNQVHIWRANLTISPEQDHRAILPAGERQRADRFRLTADRLRFTVTRALLRTILGRYLDLDPHSLCFEYSQFGKPLLAPPQNAIGITFNVTHSGNCSLLAFGAALDLGIDIEYMHIARNIEELAKAVFPPSQYRQFLARPDALRKRAFLQAWTRREAVGKALGTGLSLPEIDASEWFVADVDVADDYVAALAAQAPVTEVRVWDWKS